MLNIQYTGRKPFKANPTDAGMDLYVDKETTLHPNEPTLVGTGTRLAIPHGYYGLLTIRSSLGVKGVTLTNGVGVIDSDYRGEIRMNLYNQTREPYVLHEGERVGQIIISPIPDVVLQEVKALDVTERGESGFGSTGRT